MKKVNTNPIAIQLTDVSKIYTIHHEKPTLIEKFIKSHNEQFTALNRINLTIYKGERVGIIGPNGSGKTTLLKIISEITTPTSGTLKCNGKVISLIDLEAGFHPELTGIQNIYINGMLLGMGKNEIDQKINSIIHFAEIKKFIDTPLFTYSAGMKLRLGFSIAIHANPDILILDEVITAGDKDFQTKSRKKIDKFFKKGITIIVVTHWISFIKSNCNKVIIVNHGTITREGGLEILPQYEKHNYK